MRLEDLPEFDITNPAHFDDLPGAVDWEKYPDGMARSVRGLEVLSYQLVGEGFRRPDLRNSTEAKMAAIGFSEGPVYDVLRGMTTSTEGVEHRQMRRAFQPWFIADNVEKFRADIRSAVNHWVEENRSGPADFANELGDELPAVVFTYLVGASAAEAPFISKMSKDMLKFTVYNPAFHDIVESSVLQTLDWLGELIDHKASTPGSDVTSALLESERAGTITRDHTVRILMTLIIASVDSTRAQMACNLVALARNKDQWRALQQHPDAVANAVPELFRYHPATLTMARYCEQDTEFRGVPVPARQTLFLGAFAANNDPTVFDEPRRLDVLKVRERGPYTFGNGRHACVGRMISTIEQEELLSGLLEHWDDFDLVESRFAGAPFQQGPIALTLAATSR